MGYEELLASLRHYVDDVQSDMNVIEYNPRRSKMPLAMAEAFSR